MGGWRGSDGVAVGDTELGDLRGHPHELGLWDASW
jgi:hypothetical protein